ncbi:MAG: magnesium chelatase subunit H [Roseiflexaceae bacterium]|nr:magnesium chelatase subunit H [Roseiflexaceae bacterium]
MRFIFLTMDGNHAAALRLAADLLRRDHNVELNLGLYDATRLRSADDWARLEEEVAQADFVFGSMLFGEDFVRPLQRALAQVACPICIITSNPTLIRMTRIGKLSLAKKEEPEGQPSIFQQWSKKLRPAKSGHGEGQRQLAMLRNLGKIMKHIPGKARDLHTYIAVHQYWMHGSPENLQRMLCMLIDRYVPSFTGRLPQHDPIEYPDVALIHPDSNAPFADLESYRKWLTKKNQELPRGHPNQEPRAKQRGVVGLLSLRTVALSGNTAHLNGLFRALERRGLEVRMAYGAGLDFRPAIEKFFTQSQHRAHNHHGTSSPYQATVDVLLNGAGFSLIGGMAESRPEEATAVLHQLDVGYYDMIPLSFQRVEEWRCDDTGLSPIQVAMNVAVPELDAATEPLVFGGPADGGDAFIALDDQIELAAERIARRIGLRCSPNAEKRVAVVLFNFPPNLGNIGTAAYLDVFASLHRLMLRLQEDGYDVQVPATVEELRVMLVEGNASLHGTDGNVAARLAVADYTHLFPHYHEIEQFWGRVPGQMLNDGKSYYILGAQFGKLFVGLQPSFGYERDPMRLLMAKDATPNHAFAAFYAWLDQVFRADAVVHFGTHGALEFMPGKQVGMSVQCWPTRLLGGMPNFYYYSVNNPSEATIAKRRGAATIVSYLVPPLQQAGLYKGLRLLKDSIETYRSHPNPQLLEDIRTQAEKLGISPTIEDQADGAPTLDQTYVAALAHELILVEQRMIPIGLHVLGKPPSAPEAADMLGLIASFHSPRPDMRPLPQQIATGLGWDYRAIRDRLTNDTQAQQRYERIEAIVREALNLFVHDHTYRSVDTFLAREANIKPGVLLPLWEYLADVQRRLMDEQELNGLMRGLAGGYIPPSPANDVARNTATVPTGRNLHGLDPFRVPSPAAQVAGEQLMTELVTRLTREQGHAPETVALVLWGTDNLKSDGEGVAQALALLGTRVVLDELGKVADVELVPLRELGRPRIDVVVTASGICRDLLSHQMLLIDKAARMAAGADEPPEFNFIRKHALAQAVALGCSVDEAATRVFSNAPGSYGANVNHLVESSTWENESQLSEAFLSRKSFGLGRSSADAPYGGWREARGVMEQALGTVDVTFQNVDSFEMGISDIDHYYEYLGGITKSVELKRGARPPVLVADAVGTTAGRLSTLEQMVRLETRAKLLNPKWFEGMLAHGYQGVREIETRVGNTFGWSATADAVEGWVYQGVAETFLLDEAMRDRMAALNAHATAAMARRLLEAESRGFWDADEETLAQLQQIYADLEDRLEGVQERVVGV